MVYDSLRIISYSTLPYVSHSIILYRILFGVLISKRRFFGCAFPAPPRVQILRFFTEIQPLSFLMWNSRNVETRCSTTFQDVLMFFDASPGFEQQLPIWRFHPFCGNRGRSDFLKGRNRQSLKCIQVRQSEFFAQARGVFHCVRGAKSSCFVGPLQRGVRAGGVLAPQSVRFLQPGQVGCDRGSPRGHQIRIDRTRRCDLQHGTSRDVPCRGV